MVYRGCHYLGAAGLVGDWKFAECIKARAWVCEEAAFSLSLRSAVGCRANGASAMSMRQKLHFPLVVCQLAWSLAGSAPEHTLH